MKIIAFFLFFSVVLFPEKNSFISLFVKGHSFNAEVADTPEMHMKGLMHRESIADDYAMLFIFPGEEYRSFWMKNCRVHLDIIFLNRHKQIVDMHINVPPCKKKTCPSYESALPAQYVIELKGNLSKMLDLRVGDQFYFVYKKKT